MAAMTQVKIYGRADQLGERRQVLSETIHASLVEAFGLPEHKRFQRFIGLADEDFIHPEDRGAGYTVIEISAFSGRSPATKKRLLQLLMQRLPEATGLPVEAFEVTLLETPRENWGIRGKTGDELILDYKIER